MRAVFQRVTRASVSVGGQEIASIGKGAMVLLAVREDMKMFATWPRSPAFVSFRLRRQDEPVSPGYRRGSHLPVHPLWRCEEGQTSGLTGLPAGWVNGWPKPSTDALTTRTGCLPHGGRTGEHGPVTILIKQEGILKKLPQGRFDIWVRHQSVLTQEYWQRGH